MRLWIGIGLLALAGCATPQEQCISNASRNINVLERLIAQTEANIERGYGVKTIERIVPDGYRNCGTPEEPVRCAKTRVERETVPVAIDLNAEQSKLNSLIARRNADAKAVSATIAQCRAAYPDE